MATGDPVKIKVLDNQDCWRPFDPGSLKRQGKANFHGRLSRKETQHFTIILHPVLSCDHALQNIDKESGYSNSEYYCDVAWDFVITTFIF